MSTCSSFHCNALLADESDVDVDKSFLECVTLLTAGSSSGTIISQERRRSGANKLEEVDAPCFVIPAKTLFSTSS